MKNYQHYSVSDFILDDDFQFWILHPDERSNAFWSSWVLSHPEKAHEIEEAREVLHTLRLSNYTLPSSSVSAIWNAVQQGEFSKQNTSKANRNTAWYLGAAAILLMGFGFYFFNTSNLQQEYSTVFGETKTIVLPDSSTVILNANSSLHFNDSWGTQSAREVWLEGEAFFSVTHKVNNQPFRVLTEGGVGVEVLGTSFNLYHRSADTKVVLTTGQIRLSLPSDQSRHAKTILMKPGELVVYKENIFSKRNVDPAIYAAWTEKKIILDETTLRDMIKMAKDSYGIEIEVGSEKMLMQTVSGSMTIGDAKNFVYQMAKAFQLKVEEKNEKFLITE
ncbi:N/A [soil metagenome]